MDPTITLKRTLDPDPQTRHDAMMDLASWIERGGFMPTGLEQMYDCKLSELDRESVVRELRNGAEDTLYL